MRKTSRQLEEEIKDALRRHSAERSSRSAHASMKNATGMQSLNAAIRDYNTLASGATSMSPSHTPEEWDDVAKRIEEGIKATGVEGDSRTFASDRAKDARSRARWLQMLETRGGRDSTPRPQSRLSSSKAPSTKKAEASLRPSRKKTSRPSAVKPSPSSTKGASATPASKPFSEEELLGLVHAAIPQVGAEGRFGDEKIFISAIWQALQRSRRLGGYSLEHFKKWLLKANRLGQLLLARADLVSAMDPKLVANSEIEDRGATFHFVLDPSSLRGARASQRF